MSLAVSSIEAGYFSGTFISPLHDWCAIGHYCSRSISIFSGFPTISLGIFEGKKRKGKEKKKKDCENSW